MKKNNDFKSRFYKRLIKFSLDVIKFSRKLEKDKILQILGKQLIRSSTSIGANLIEAKASSSKKDYLHYFQIALKSANEFLYWLYLIKSSDKNLIRDSENLLKELDEICKILGSSILTMKGKRKL